jgi:hypothetical protein
MIPTCAEALPCTLTTRATIVPSPVSGWYTKWKPSALVTIVPDPAPDTVNIPFAKPALPATPTEPISPSDQTEGSGPSAGLVTVRFTVVELVRPATEAVTVTVTVPVAAVLVAASVNVLVLAVLVGLNDAVTPLGRPDAVKLTLALKPFCGLTVIELVPLAPCVIVKVLGDAESVKFPGGLTVRERVVVFAKLPDEPVIVTVTVPVAAVPLAASVKVLVFVVLAGLNDAVTPLGKPDADKLTLPLKPYSGVTVIVLAPLVPCAIVILLSEVESEKFGGGGPGEVSDTLSKVAVAKEAVVRLLTAGPMYTLVAMLTVWLVPNCTQFTPFADPYMLNTFPLRTSFIQFGSVALPID